MKHSERFLAIVEDAKSRIREITVEEVRADQESGVEFILIDVREESEFAASRAAGAIHLGKGVIERDIETTVPEFHRKLVLYCGGGYRSALAADALTKMGYENALSLAGGWRAWNAAEMPVEEE